MAKNKLKIQHKTSKHIYTVTEREWGEICKNGSVSVNYIVVEGVKTVGEVAPTEVESAKES